jgi:hypothetical protein
MTPALAAEWCVSVQNRHSGAKQALEKHSHAGKFRFGPGLVKGHGFSRAAKATIKSWGYRACGRTPLKRRIESFVKGHGFSQADKGNQINVGL